MKSSTKVDWDNRSSNPSVAIPLTIDLRLEDAVKERMIPNVGNEKRMLLKWLLLLLLLVNREKEKEKEKEKG